MYSGIWDTYRFCSSPYLDALGVALHPHAGLAWNQDSTSVAIATDHILYVASVRRNHMFVRCADALVYAYKMPESRENAIAFWNIRTGEQHYKPSKPIICMAAGGDTVAIATKETTWAKVSLTILNSIGSPIDRRSLTFEPSMMAMTSDHIITCNMDLVYVRRFCTSEVCQQIEG
jgi:hypothetical protein